MMRQIRLIILSFLLLSTSGCGESSKPIVITASLALPIDLLEVNTYQVQLTLTDPSGTSIFWGTSPLTWNAENSLWQAEIEDLGEGDYLAILELLADALPPVIIARANRTFSFPDGTSSVNLTFRPSDFSTEIDDDGDTLTNLSEYSGGLDPFSTDSDGDGVPDNEETGGL